MSPAQDLIVITGCSGRIGTRVIDRFKNSPYRLIGLDLVPPHLEQPNLEYIRMDISSDESVKQAFSEIKERFGDHIASVIHLAAYYNFAGGLWEKYRNITILGTGRLLDLLRHFNVQQFIFSSTMLVHSPQDPPHKITEDSPLEGDWEYPRSKIETESLIHKMHGRIPTVILRIAACYDDECHSIPLSNQIQRIYEGQFASHVFPGATTHGAAFLHLDDMAEAIWLAVQKRKELPPEVTLLVGEPETLSYNQLQRQISQLLYGKDFKTYRIPKWFAKAGAWLQGHTPFMKPSFIKPWMIDLADQNYVLDLSRIQHFLGWNPSHSLKETLPKILQDLKKDPLKWYQVNQLTPPSWLKKKEEKPSCSSCYKL